MTQTASSEAPATTRVCGGCGEPECRWTDAAGRQHLNLEPTSGLCLACLVARAKGRPARQKPSAPVFDPRAAAARNDA